MIVLYAEGQRQQQEGIIVSSVGVGSVLVVLFLMIPTYDDGLWIFFQYA